MIEDEAAFQLSDAGTLRGHHSSVFAQIRGTQPLPAKVGSAEQSNTSIIFGKNMILKLFRRLQSGENPDVEIGRFLTDVAHFPNIATFLGEITLHGAGGEKTSAAMLQEFVANDGDGWQWTLDELARFYEASTANPAEEFASPYLDAAALLGRRTAEMHLALATETPDEAFQSEPLTAHELAADASRIRGQIGRALDALDRALPSLTADAAPDAAKILSLGSKLLAATDALLREPASGQMIRIHGDFHLGQVLRANDDFVLLDFEGEPARSLAERRKKQCPLKDVAGMLRSFSYAAWAALEQHTVLHPDTQSALLPQLRVWQDAVSARFLSDYHATIATRPNLLPDPPLAQSLLSAYLLEKACYELLYELNNRPTWVRIPMAGILALSAPDALPR